MTAPGSRVRLRHAPAVRGQVDAVDTRTGSARVHWDDGRVTLCDSERLVELDPKVPAARLLIGLALAAAYLIVGHFS